MSASWLGFVRVRAAKERNILCFRGRYQINVTDAKGSSNFIEGYDGGVAPPVFQFTQILLGKARGLCQLLLGQSFILSNSSDILSD